jgi:hypothetical protein
MKLSLGSSHKRWNTRRPPRGDALASVSLQSPARYIVAVPLSVAAMCVVAPFVQVASWTTRQLGASLAKVSEPDQVEQGLEPPEGLS